MLMEAKREIWRRGDHATTCGLLLVLENRKKKFLPCWCSLIPAGTRARRLEKGRWLGCWEVPSHSEGPTVTGTDTYPRHTAMGRATTLFCPARSSGNLSRSEARLSSTIL